jgi:16S rRNA (adenine1518-N6/adenine1519-N6)-dimethyltransferase
MLARLSPTGVLSAMSPVMRSGLGLGPLGLGSRRNLSSKLLSMPLFKPVFLDKSTKNPKIYRKNAPKKRKNDPRLPFKIAEKPQSFLPENKEEREKRHMRSISGSPTLLARGLEVVEKNRPFTIPKGEFKPNKSLGQNFLSDQNYVNKIVNAFHCTSKLGCRVMELGPGPGALTRVLFQRYPQMTGVEVDKRAIMFLKEKIPDVNIIHQDVLKIDWPQTAADKSGPMSVIGNLPYNITSQILFSLIDSHKAVKTAVVTAQYEVGARIVAKPKTKQYGILSVAFQLYTTPKMNFKIPATVFFPKPKVVSCLMTLDFSRPHPGLHRVSIYQLRRLLLTSFQQRRKMLRKSLKDLLQNEGLELPEEYQTKRPEELSPEDFLRLTTDLFGENILDGSDLLPSGTPSRKERSSPEKGTVVISDEGDVEQYQHTDDSGGGEYDLGEKLTRDQFASPLIWRRSMIPYLINNTNLLHKNILDTSKKAKQFRKLLSQQLHPPPPVYFGTNSAIQTEKQEEEEEDLEEEEDTTTTTIIAEGADTDDTKKAE